MFAISKRPTIGEIHELYRSGKAIPSQVTQFFLNRSKDTDRQILAFLRYTEEIAARQSHLLDDILKQYIEAHGTKNYFEVLIKDYPLFGIPFTVKDNILVEGVEISAGSKVLEGFVAPYSATVYERMIMAGSILIGITNMDEFAVGSSGEQSAYQITKNPFDTTRVPGGSSSGPIAAVASGQVVFSLGSDTGGSIRQPAAFCDVVGLKPTYGLVSRFGVVPMASSFDQVGPISNSVADSILITKILAGKDQNDQTSVDASTLIEKLDGYIENKKSIRATTRITKTRKPLKIGLPKEFYIDGIDPIIRDAIENLKSKLVSLGHQLVDVSIPMTKYAISVYYMTMPVEFAANVERYDGIRYAYKPDGENQELFYTQRYNSFGQEPKRRIMLGTYASSAGYYDAYYNRAQKVRQLAREDFLKAFEQVDVILTPTTPEFPFKVGTKTNDPLKMYLSDVFTCGINPVRIPGISIPLGLFNVPTDDGEVQLPTSCQLLGPELSEDVLFALGEEIEAVV